MSDTIITLKLAINAAELNILRIIKQRNGHPLPANSAVGEDNNIALNTLEEKGLVRKHDGLWSLTYLGMTANLHPEMN